MMHKKYIPLDTVPGFSKAATGYFWNTEDGHLYSTKQTTTPQRLYGSLVGGVRRYTLQMKPNFKYWSGQTMTARQDFIKSSVASTTKKVYNKVVAEMENKVPGVPNKVPGVPNKVPGVPNKGWIVGSVSGGNFSISATPKVHTTEASVNAEIERLAKLNTGKMYVKMKLEAFAQAGGVAWL